MPTATANLPLTQLKNSGVLFDWLSVNVFQASAARVVLAAQEKLSCILSRLRPSDHHWTVAIGAFLSHRHSEYEFG